MVLSAFSASWCSLADWTLLAACCFLMVQVESGVPEGRASGEVGVTGERTRELFSSVYEYSGSFMDLIIPFINNYTKNIYNFIIKLIIFYLLKVINY